jgi:DNA (cytosine-5)-methyltransferase 1
VSTKINQLDLFSGIGGFHLGFERAGYEVTSYFSEIDKHAVAVYQHKFKDATYVGSVTDVRGADLPNIDLITFGSPCQDFSLAGKRKGMDGERSSLILEAIRLITECQPRAFVWENVKGTFSSNDGEDFAAILQAFSNIRGYRLEWQLLNTSWFLPQNRERIYLVGYSTTPTGDWGGVFPIGEEPRADNGIPRQQGNTCTLTTRYGADGNGSYITKRKQYAQEIEPLKIKVANKKGYQEAVDGDAIRLYQPNSETQRGRVGKGVAHTLETTGQQGVVQPVQIGQSSQTFAHKSGTLIGEDGQDAFTIRSSNPNGVKVEQPYYQDIEIGDIRYDEGGFRPRKNGIAPALVGSNDKSGTPNCSILKNNSTYRIRRLTPIECERLQGFPDNHTEYGIYDGEVKKMSNTQRYKQCGNAVTVDVVKAVAQQLIPIYNA